MKSTAEGFGYERSPRRRDPTRRSKRMSGKEAPTSYAELADVIDNLPILIREARRARGLSGRAAAKESGVNFSTLARIEGGEDARGGTLTAVLRWLDNPAAPREGSIHETRRGTTEAVCDQCGEAIWPIVDAPQPEEKP